jgi:pimeloyl-ACP methyl ester carboxylesterase
MATPTLTKHSVSGALGPILIDVRAAGRTSSRPAVLVLHGFKGFKDWGMFPQFSERLARAGFAALTLNLSGSGVDDAGEFSLPDQFGHNTFSAELSDIRSVIDALCSGELGVTVPSSLALVGHSRGGGVAILETARNPRINALVTWSAIASVQRWSAEQRGGWRASGVSPITNSRTGQVLPLYTDVLDDIDQNAATLDIEAAARSVTVPWLIAHGAQDETVPFREAVQLRSANSRPTTRLLTVEGAGHTFGATHPWSESNPELEMIFDATLGWLATHLH